MGRNTPSHKRKFHSALDEIENTYDESLAFHRHEERFKYKKNSRLEWKFKFYLHDEDPLDKYGRNWK